MKLDDIRKSYAEDAVVRTSSYNGKTGTVTVPALTTAVFVTEQK